MYDFLAGFLIMFGCMNIIFAIFSLMAGKIYFIIIFLLSSASCLCIGKMIEKFLATPDCLSTSWGSTGIATPIFLYGVAMAIFIAIFTIKDLK